MVMWKRDDSKNQNMLISKGRAARTHTPKDPYKNTFVFANGISKSNRKIRGMTVNDVQYDSVAPCSHFIILRLRLLVLFVARAEFCSLYLHIFHFPV